MARLLRQKHRRTEILLGGVLLYLVLFCCLGGVKYKSVIGMLADILVA